MEIMQTFRTLLLLVLFFQAFGAYAQEKPKVFVFTDIGGDPDDEQSLVRFLHYANEFDIQGFGVTSRLQHGQDIRPDIIGKHLDAYAEILPNLKIHASGFPEATTLKKTIRKGNGDWKAFGKGFDSEASDYLIEVVDKSAHTVHVLVWGGLRELAQALWKVKESRNESEVGDFVRKIQVHAIGDQDGHRNWILKNFADLKFIADGFAWQVEFGIRELAAFRGMYMTGDRRSQDLDWIKNRVYGNGPLADLYPAAGGGVPGMKEGDSPSFLGLIGNGLNVPENPEWGGWGGRYRHLRNNLYIDAPDFLEGRLNERHSVSRWRPAFQHDFMARLTWGTISFEETNHNPVAVVNGDRGLSPLFIYAAPGNTIVLDAAKSYDPDGNELEFNWFVYEEIYKPTVPILSPGEKHQTKVQFICPDLPEGTEFHVILEVTDNGTPSLTGYKRIIVQIE